MRFIIILLITLLISAIAVAQNYSVDRYVIASGGGEIVSTSYSANGTAGQPIVGRSSSNSWIVESGFWVGAGGPGGCDYVVGDVNGSSSYNGLDITYGVNFFKGGSDPMCPLGSCPIIPCNWFFYCGDVNASCNYNGLDITYGVNYLKGGSAPVPCEDCPPIGAIADGSSGRLTEPAANKRGGK
jgi:hypothetical protein